MKTSKNDSIMKKISLASFFDVNLSVVGTVEVGAEKQAVDLFNCRSSCSRSSSSIVAVV